MQSPPEFQHEPGLFAFLQYQCTLADAPALGYDVHKDEQQFLEAVEYDDDTKACVRKAARRSGGTTLFCAMAWHYHLMGYRVAVSTHNHAMLEYLRRTLKDVHVIGFKPETHNSKNRIYLTTNDGQSRAPNDIHLLVAGNQGDFRRVFQAEHHDYVFMDNVSANNEHDAIQAVMVNTSRKVVVNVTP